MFKSQTRGFDLVFLTMTSLPKGYVIPRLEAGEQLASVAAHDGQHRAAAAVAGCDSRQQIFAQFASIYRARCKHCRDFHDVWPTFLQKGIRPVKPWCNDWYQKMMDPPPVNQVVSNEDEWVSSSDETDQENERSQDAEMDQ